VFALLTLLVEASRLFVPSGTLPKESRVEIVQIETGWFETCEIGEGPGDVPDFKSPTGTLVVSVFGPNGASRGFTRLAVKRGEEIAIQVPTSPARGRGQLSLELAFPKDAKPDPKDVSALTSREWTLAKPLNPDVPERGALALRGELVPKPSLRLRFDVAESVGHGPVEVDLLDCEKQRNFPGPTPIERCTLVSSQKGRSDTATEDLENARPTVKTIPIRPFEVFGRVTAGGQTVAATLLFWAVNTGHTFETDADENGFYRIALTLFAIDGVAFADGSNRITLVGGDFQSRPDGTFRIGGLPAAGNLTIWPFGIPQLAVTRPLPVTEEIVFTVPAR
jgi:hypothetical protein